MLKTTRIDSYIHIYVYNSNCVFFFLALYLASQFRNQYTHCREQKFTILVKASLSVLPVSKCVFVKFVLFFPQIDREPTGLTDIFQSRSVVGMD